MKVRRTENGQAILEFALAMPFLLAFLFFIIDAGLFGYTYVSATNAVREGARCGAVGGTSAAVKARVTQASNGLNSTVITPSNPTYAPSPATIGGSITVGAALRYEWITPVGLVPGINRFSTYTKSATMRMETADTTTKASC